MERWYKCCWACLVSTKVLNIKYICNLCPPFIHVNIIASIWQEILFIHTNVELSYGWSLLRALRNHWGWIKTSYIPNVSWQKTPSCFKLVENIFNLKAPKQRKELTREKHRSDYCWVKQGKPTYRGRPARREKPNRTVSFIHICILPMHLKNIVSWIYCLETTGWKPRFVVLQHSV